MQILLFSRAIPCVLFKPGQAVKDSAFASVRVTSERHHYIRS
ncbi:MAG: hypothetical protein DDT20_00587 [Firmicutes bacterium]|nr:hypothetical protein [Bacillota bacterium]